MRTLALAAAASLALSGCATTRIYTDDPEARVYANGKEIGRGHGELRQWGPPHTAEVWARAPDGRRGRLHVKRHFGFGALALGVVTYGVCWFACWQYPETVYLRLDEPPARTVPVASWDVVPAVEDPWMAPPAGWGGAAGAGDRRARR